MKTVAILSNDHSWTYNLRKELIEALLQSGYHVVLILPYGEKVEVFKQMGCGFFDVPAFARHGTNVLQDIKLYRSYCRILKEVKPDVVLTFTIKPNAYGGMACQRLRIPYIPNVTGLGSAMQPGLKQRIMLKLYGKGIKNASIVFFQNVANRDYLKKQRIPFGKYRLIPGSGVNTDSFPLQPYPEGGDGKTGATIVFNYIGRVMQAKGIDDYIAAAKRIHAAYPKTEFNVIGPVEQTENQYLAILQELDKQGVIRYRGSLDDVRPLIAGSHATIHPSVYGEGVSNVLLESASSGRPLITTDNPGCCDTVDDKITGFIYEGGKAAMLTECVERFLAMDNESRRAMGERGRKKVSDQFSRRVVVDAYLEELNTILNNGSLPVG